MSAVNEAPEVAVLGAQDQGGGNRADQDVGQLLFSQGGQCLQFAPGFVEHSLPQLRAQREERKDCDVVFTTAEGDRLWAHWFVLAATYPGCHELLCKAELRDTCLPARDCQQPQHACRALAPPSEVFVSGISASLLSLLIDFAYGVRLQERVGLHNVRDVLELADTLNIKQIQSHCLDLLKSNISPNNCIGLYQLAARKDYKSLATEALLYITRNFKEVSDPEFESMTLEELCHILSSDGLQVSSEIRGTFQVILKWIEADVNARRVHLSRCLQLLRFDPNFTVREFETLATHPRVQADQDSLAVLDAIYRVERCLQTLTGQPVDAECGVDLSDQRWREPRVPKDILFLFGGLAEPTGAVNNELLSYDCRARRWRKIPRPHAAPRSQHGVAVVDGLVYFVGGFNGKDYCHSVACFDPARNKWTRKASLAKARSVFAIAVLENYIYAMGGTDNQYFLSSCERYDTKNDQWVSLPRMRDARAGGCGAAIAGHVYVVGGFSGLEFLDTVERYDPSAANVWTIVSVMPQPRSGAQVLAEEGILYVVGGFNGTELLNSVIKYNYRSNTWSEAPSMTTPRTNLGVAFLDGCIYAVGGFDGMTTVSAVEVYDIKAGTWGFAPPLEKPREGMAAFVLRDVPEPGECSRCFAATTFSRMWAYVSQHSICTI